MKPFDNDVVINKIKQVSLTKNQKNAAVRPVASASEPEGSGTSHNLETDVTNIIHEIGVPAYQGVVNNLEDAIIYVCGQPGKLFNSITKVYTDDR